MPYPHSWIYCHFSYDDSLSCGQLARVWAKVFGPFCPLGIACICTKAVFSSEHLQRTQGNMPADSPMPNVAWCYSCRLWTLKTVRARWQFWAGPTEGSVLSADRSCCICKLWVECLKWSCNLCVPGICSAYWCWASHNSVKWRIVVHGQKKARPPLPPIHKIIFFIQLFYESSDIWLLKLFVS